MPDQNLGEVIVYQSSDGLTRVDVRFQNETVWLTQQQMADLFQTSRTNVVEHIRHIYEAIRDVMESWISRAPTNMPALKPTTLPAALRAVFHNQSRS